MRKKTSDFLFTIAIVTGVTIFAWFLYTLITTEPTASTDSQVRDIQACEEAGYSWGIKESEAGSYKLIVFCKHLNK